MGEKDSVPGSLPARLGRGSTAIKGQVYLHGAAAEYLLKSAKPKRLSPKLHRKSININLEDILLNNGHSGFDGALEDSLSSVG